VRCTGSTCNSITRINARHVISYTRTSTRTHDFSLSPYRNPMCSAQVWPVCVYILMCVCERVQRKFQRDATPCIELSLSRKHILAQTDTHKCLSLPLSLAHALSRCFFRSLACASTPHVADDICKHVCCCVFSVRISCPLFLFLTHTQASLCIRANRISSPCDSTCQTGIMRSPMITTGGGSGGGGGGGGGGACVRACVCVCVRACVCVCVHACVRACMHVRWRMGCTSIGCR